MAASYTRAIKNTKRFTLLHSHRAMDLSDPRYTLGKNRGTVFSLRSYDPSVSSCFIKIWAGPAEREFSDYRVTDDLKLIQQRFAAFRLAIMWCFLTLPSDVTSSWQSYETETDSELAAMSSQARANSSEWFANGVDEDDAIDGFRSIRRVMRDWHVEAMARAWPEELQDRGLVVVKSIGSAFCREGQTSSVEFQEHAGRCRLVFSMKDAELFDALSTARSAIEFWNTPGPSISA